MRHWSSRKIPKETRARVFKRDGYRCRKCGASDDLTIDHVLALALGGSSGAWNLQTLCADCNIKKGNALVFAEGM